MSFAVAPRARNGHEVGGSFLLEEFEEFMRRLAGHARERGVGHLGPDGVGRDSV